MSSLVERLGFESDAKLVIITSVNLGSCQAANAGSYMAMREGVVTGASLMLPCPWARGAASDYRGEDVGLQLTLNAELDNYRWGPLTHAPSLLDGDGGFPRTLLELWDHADLDEVRRECRTQIERAIVWGFDVSHLGTHMEAISLKPELFDIYLDLAIDFRLPIRLPDSSHQRSAGFPFRDLAQEEGVVFPDRVIDAQHTTLYNAIELVVGELGAGVTEIVVRPAIDSPELRALSPNWADCTDEALDESGELREMMKRSGAHFIGYRKLRALQRSLLSAATRR